MSIFNTNRFLVSRLVSLPAIIKHFVHLCLVTYLCWTSCRTLTRSWSGYHFGVGSSKILFSRGIRTSPRKSLRPNMSECQTVSHRVLVSRPLRLIWNWNVVVTNHPSSNFHAGTTEQQAKHLCSRLVSNDKAYLQCFVKLGIQRVFLHLSFPFAALWLVRQ